MTYSPHRRLACPLDLPLTALLLTFRVVAVPDRTTLVGVIPAVRAGDSRQALKQADRFFEQLGIGIRVVEPGFLRTDLIDLSFSAARTCSPCRSASSNNTPRLGQPDGRATTPYCRRSCYSS